MSDRILYCQNNLEDLAGKIGDMTSMLQQIQHALSGVDTAPAAGGDLHVGSGVALSELTSVRIAGGTVKESVSAYQSALRQLSDYTTRLQGAVKRVDEAFLETEKKIMNQKTESAQHGGGAGRSFDSGVESGRTESALTAIQNELNKFKRNTQGSLEYIKRLAQMIASLILGREYKSGDISGKKGTLFYSENDSANIGVCDYEVWNNDCFSLTWQEVYVFGKKVRMLVPYINIGTGVRVDGVQAGMNGSQGGQSLSVSGSVGSAYAGYKFECGFVNGEFVLHIEAGLGASVFTVEGEASTGQYTSAGVSTDWGSTPGAAIQIDYSNGKLHVEVGGDFIAGVTVSGTLDVGQLTSDIQNAINKITHGDIISGFKDMMQIQSALNSATA